MLTYEDELLLSDAIVRRREVTDRLDADERKPNADERRIIDEGNKAAADLVEAYLPKIRSIAWSVSSRHYGSTGNSTEIDDLINEGVDAAMRCAAAFNARGKNGRAGLRFASYSGPAIAKAMNRYVAKMSTPLRDDVSVIQMSWAWLAVRANLEAELGRPPTDKEVEEKSQISTEYVRKDLPHRSAFMDIDDPEAGDVASGDNVVIQIAAEHDAATAILVQALGDTFNEEMVRAVCSYLGVDRMYPRMDDDMADHLGISIRRARWWIEMVQSALIHPYYRMMLARAVERAGYSPEPSGA